MCSREAFVVGTIFFRWCFERVDVNFWITLFCAETKYQLHAKEVVKSLDLDKYDGIVCVSGDGILVEVGRIVVFMLTADILSHFCIVVLDYQFP